MDTGHTHKAHDIEPSVLDTVDAIRYLGKDIKLLHLNDNNGYSDQHLPPFLAGDSLQLKWKDIMAVLDEVFGIVLPRKAIKCANCAIAVLEYKDGTWALYSWINTK